MLADFLRILSTSTQHRTFYHFTDSRNIPSIEQQGCLLSMRLLKERGIVCPAPGGDEWSMEADERVGMDAYVHLCFTNGHPMEYMARNDGRIQRTAWLRVLPEVVESDGVMVTLDVSNKAGIAPVPVLEALEMMDLEVIYKRTNWKDPAIQTRLKQAEKYELLVPRKIALNYIANPHG